MTDDEGLQVGLNGFIKMNAVPMHTCSHASSARMEWYVVQAVLHYVIDDQLLPYFYRTLICMHIVCKRARPSLCASSRYIQIVLLGLAEVIETVRWPGRYTTPMLLAASVA